MSIFGTLPCPKAALRISPEVKGLKLVEFHFESAYCDG